LVISHSFIFRTDRIKKEDEIKIVNKSFDDRNYSQNQSVNVLEISEGGISGDVTMQENKFLEIIKNEEQMAKLTPVNEDDKKAPIAEIEQKDLTIENNIENNNTLILRIIPIIKRFVHNFNFIFFLNFNRFCFPRILVFLTSCVFTF
jgi:hypothetical protein